MHQKLHYILIYAHPKLDSMSFACLQVIKCRVPRGIASETFHSASEVVFVASRPSKRNIHYFLNYIVRTKINKKIIMNDYDFEHAITFVFIQTYVKVLNVKSSQR